MSIRTYLSSLSRPTSWNDLADLLGKTIFAFAAALIASVVGYYSQAKLAADRRAQAVEEQRLAEQSEMRESLSNRRDEISLFLDYMPRDSTDPQWKTKITVLSSYCSETARERITGAIGKVLCQQVSNIGNSVAGETRAAASSLVVEAARTGDSARYVGSAVANSQSLALAASESAAPSLGDRWYAVIASVPLSQPGAVHQLAADLNQRLQRAGLPADDVHVYRTRISNSFAITSGRDKSESEAKARVRMLRQSGQIPDAFAQPNRGWVPADEVR